MKATRVTITALMLAALTAGAWAQTATSSTAAKKKRKPAAATESAQPAASAADVQALKDAVAAQQQQIQQLMQQLQQNQQAWQQAQQQLQAAQSVATDAQQKASSAQAAEDQQQSTVAKLSSDVADVKTTVTNDVVSSQEAQKRVSALESAFGRFRFSGDMRVRGESFFQNAVPDRNRARVRARFGVDGQLNEDFIGGIYIASGTLGDPTTSNETLTNFFDRKTLGIDRAYITYNPVAHKWLSLSGGKFPFPWARTSLTFDPDINPEGFDAKLSFDMHRGALRNFTAQGFEFLFNEVSKGPDSYAAGGNVSARFEFGPWTLNPSYSLVNWHLADALLQASAFAVQSTTTGSSSTGTSSGNVPGEGPGCATVLGGPAFPPCAFAANGMTNATTITLDSKGNPVPHFLSHFLYSDFVLNNTIKTPIARMPINLLAEYEQNLNAASNPLDTVGGSTGLDKQDKAYGLDVSLGQSKNKGDFQIGTSWWRIEQDAVIASFAESDQRAPTNITQNRVYGMYRLQKNVLAQYTLWFGRVLNNGLENNPGSIKTAPGDPNTPEPRLKRQQIDLIYTF